MEENGDWKVFYFKNDKVPKTYNKHNVVSISTINVF